MHAYRKIHRACRVMLFVVQTRHRTLDAPISVLEMHGPLLTNSWWIGSINEVDLLVLSPAGLFLIEIKSQPGELRGDAGTWTWLRPDGKYVTTDNPLLLTNQKAKKLVSLLGRQKAVKRKRGGRVPFIESLVFCSAPEVDLQLEGTAAYRVCLRDREQDGDAAGPGIIAALEHRDCPGLDPRPRGQSDSDALARCLHQTVRMAAVS